MIQEDRLVTNLLLTLCCLDNVWLHCNNTLQQIAAALSLYYDAGGSICHELAVDSVLPLQCVATRPIHRNTLQQHIDLIIIMIQEDRLVTNLLLTLCCLYNVWLQERLERKQLADLMKVPCNTHCNMHCNTATHTATHTQGRK